MKRNFPEKSSKGISVREAYISISYFYKGWRICLRSRSQKCEVLTNFDNLTGPQSIATSGTLILYTSEILRRVRELRVFILSQRNVCVVDNIKKPQILKQVVSI